MSFSISPTSLRPPITLPEFIAGADSRTFQESEMIISDAGEERRHSPQTHGYVVSQTYLVSAAAIGTGRNRIDELSMHYTRLLDQRPAVAFSKHETALVETEWVGDGTRIGAFVHILAGARIGSDCNIWDYAFIGSGVAVGDGVTIQCGVQLGGGPNYTEQPTRIGSGATVGANATIVPGVQIAEHVVVSAGTVVTRDVPRNAIVTGNPARIVGYAGAESAALPGAAPVETGPEDTSVEGVILQHLPRVADLRGMLTFGEAGREVPFEVKRYFVVFDVDTEQVRGEHAHRTLHQFLVCVHGRCCVVADDGRHRREFVLDSPHIGLYIPPMTWAVQYKYSADGVLLALTSDVYNPADYIRDYAEFLALKRGPGRNT